MKRLSQNSVNIKRTFRNYKNLNVSRILKMKPLKDNGCNIKRPFIQQAEIGYFNDPIHISQGV